LAQPLRRRSTRHSARQLSRLARERGFTLNHDTAARYLRGDHGRPDEPTLRAFAAVLELDLADLRAAAGLPYEQTEPYLPPPEASRLSRRQRRAVDELIRSMLEPALPPGEVTESVDELAARRLAARHGEVEPPQG